MAKASDLVHGSKWVVNGGKISFWAWSAGDIKVQLPAGTQVIVVIESPDEGTFEIIGLPEGHAVTHVKIGDKVTITDTYYPQLEILS